MRILDVAAFLFVATGVLLFAVRGRLPAWLGMEQLGARDLFDVGAFILNLFALAVAIGALSVARETLTDARRSGTEQKAALDDSVRTLKGVLGALTTQHGTLEAARGALEKVQGNLANQEVAMNNLLTAARTQTGLIEQQNTRELERLARRPEVELAIEGVQATGPVRLAAIRADGMETVGVPNQEHWKRPRARADSLRWSHSATSTTPCPGRGQHCSQHGPVPAPLCPTPR